MLVVDPSSVLDNVWLGTDGLARSNVPHGTKVERARAVLDELLGGAPDLRTPVEELSLSDRQAVSIARALVREPRLLILDEATSALDVATRDRLFAILRRVCAGGAGVLFISHRMDEIDEIADRITVMRSGTTVDTLVRRDASTEKLVRLMTGSEHLVETQPEEPVRRRAGAEVLRVSGLRLRPDGAPLDASIHAGELVGLAGLEGHGQEAFLRALGGAGAATGEVVAGDGTAITSPRQAAARGIAHVPRDRRAESIFPTLTILENFGVPTLRRDTRAGLVSFGTTQKRFGDYIERLGIKLGRSCLLGQSEAAFGADMRLNQPAGDKVLHDLGEIKGWDILTLLDIRPADDRDRGLPC